MINHTKMLILYLGGGIISFESCKEAIELAEKNQLPTTMTLMGLGLMPPSYPLYLGIFGMHVARSTNFILEESDLLIVVGASFDDRAIGNAEKFCPNAKIIHIDIDRAEISKIKRPDLAIHADAKSVLSLLLPLINTEYPVNNGLSVLMR